MGITGTWYWNPGDIPVDWAIPVVLHEDGRAEWKGGTFGTEQYRVIGDRLIIGDATAGHMSFRIDPEDPEFMGGVMKSPVELDEGELEELEEGEAAEPRVMVDSVALFRDPGDLKIREGEADAAAPVPIAANDTTPEAGDQGTLALL